MIYVKLSQEQHKIYDIIMGALAVAEVLLILIHLSDGLDGYLQILYRIILGIFYVDYAVRFRNAKNKSKFLKHNICDLIALIPIRSLVLLCGLHMPESTLRFCMIPRMVALLYRPFRKTTKMLETNGFKYVVFISVSLILTGGILIHFAEGMSIEDGIWWAFVTTTTVGYGDLSPGTVFGRMIAMALMIVGIGLIGSLTSTLTAYFMGEKNATAKDRTIHSIQEQLGNFDELTSQDVSHICTLLTAMKNEQMKSLYEPDTQKRPNPRKNPDKAGGSSQKRNPDI